MAKLRLSSHPAEPTAWGSITINFSFVDAAPYPTEIVDIRTANDALAAFASYRERVKATGNGAAVFGMLTKGERAPSGFRKLKLESYVNCDARKGEAA